MKALSIKQPWASLIAHGIKDIENRTWKTKFRGRIFIHASSVTVKFEDLVNAPNEIFQHSSSLRDNHEIFKTYPHGAIIGEVDIVDCVINHPSIWAEKEEDLTKKPIYNWVLANPVLYEKPILNVKGKLSFWDYEKPVRKYQPSNGTEGDIFINQFCNRCCHEKFIHTQNDNDKMCNIFSDSLIYNIKDEEYPKEWIYDNNGLPICTKFKKHDWFSEDGDLIEPDDIEEIDPNQLELF